MKSDSSRQSRLDQLYKQLNSDNNLPLYSDRIALGYQSVLGEGNLNSSILIVGEAPGENEAKIGRPFIGRSGKLLDSLLAHIGLSREDIFITNVVHDRPPKNRNPKPVEILLYRPYLLGVIEIIRPKIIVTLGNFAYREIFAHFGLENSQAITKIHGTMYMTKTGEILFPCFHPAVAIYDRKKLRILEEDIAKLQKYVKDS